MNIHRGSTSRAALLASLLVASGAAGTQQPSPDVGWIDQVGYDEDGVALRLEKDGRITNVDGAIVINAPRQAIWDILVACDIAPEYVPHVVACRSIDTVNDGRSELFIQTVKPAIFIPSFEHVFRMDYEPYNRIDINRVSGPIKLLDGTWRLFDHESGGVLLTYRLALDPGIPVPRFFVRATLRHDLPTVLLAIRQRAEDRARGPG